MAATTRAPFPPNTTSSTWYADTGATHHVTNDLSNLSFHQPYTGHEQVIVGNGQGLAINHVGTSAVAPSTSGSNFILHNILHVLSISQNLLFVRQFTRDNSCLLIFSPFDFVIKDLHSGKVLYRGPIDGDLYPIHHQVSSPSPPKALLSAVVSPLLWHRRIGHPSSYTLHHLLANEQLHFPSAKSSFVCSDCQLGWHSMLPFPTSSSFTSSPPELVHTDVWGPAPTSSVTGFRYYIIFVDDWSRFTWLFPLRHKSDVFTTFQHFKSLVEKQFNLQIKTLRCDNGGEYTSTSFRTFLANHGIQQQFSCPHTPEQNGLAERKHHHILELIRTLFAQSNLPHKYWVEIAHTSVYLINRLPSKSLHNLSLLQQLFNCVPDYNFLKAYGCACYPWLRPYTSNKFEFCSCRCIFIGYGIQHKGYRCLDLSTGKVYISRHVTFDENTFPLKSHPSHPIPDFVYASPHSPSFLPLPPLPTQHPTSTLHHPNSSPYRLTIPSPTYTSPNPIDHQPSSPPFQQ